MQLTSFSMSREELEEFAALVFLESLEHLERAGLLMESDMEDQKRRFTPLVVKRESLFRTIREAVFGKQTDPTLGQMLVRFVELPETAAVAKP